MKKLSLFLTTLFVVVCTASVYAFADKDKAEVNRQVSGFERIRLQGSPDIKYTQGKTWSVRVKAPKKLIDRVVTRKDGNTLVVSMKSGSFFNSIKGDDVTVYVTSPDLIGVEVQGSGDFESKDRVDTDYLDLSVRGSGDISMWMPSSRTSNS